MPTYIFYHAKYFLSTSNDSIMALQPTSDNWHSMGFMAHTSRCALVNFLYRVVLWGQIIHEVSPSRSININHYSVRFQSLCWLIGNIKNVTWNKKCIKIQMRFYKDFGFIVGLPSLAQQMGPAKNQWATTFDLLHLCRNQSVPIN